VSFEVGRLSAALTLEGVDQFHRDLDTAGRKLQETGQRGASFGKAAEAAVRTAAGATTGLVTAASAYLTILTRQGVAYNSLQQNSRAALSVLLGGAEKANEQMARLDDFARNSPFSKDVFIQAQQQLIGFGLEAQKVVPTLDAIQQGVAAMGGSNDDIREIVRILAQVQSTGEFTGVTLRQLGIRGVDAAQIIGERMGKTGQEIKDALTDGSLGGREAMDLLVEGMDAKFGGAADNVKQQWSGAVDRIKAANRDLGSVIAEPFVSAQGGGMAVTWGNQVADVLRAIEKQAIPVMGIVTQRGMPFFASLTEGLDSSAQAIARWNPASLENSLDRMSGHAPGIAALAGAVLALGAQVGPLGRLLSMLGISANPAVAAFVGLAAASPEVRAALGGLLEAGKPLLPVVGELATVLSGSLNTALPLVAGGVELLTSVLEVVVGIIDAIPAPVLAGAAAFLAMHQASKVLAAPLGTVISLLMQFGQRAQVQAAIGGTSTAMGALSTASMGAKGAVEGLGAAMKAAFLSNPVGIALTVVATAVGAWAMANAAAQQKVEEHRARVSALKDTLNQTTGALTEATEVSVAAALAEGDHADSLERIGYSQRAATAAVIEGGEAYAELKDRIEENISMGLADADAINASADAKKLSNDAGRALLETVERETEAIREGQQAVRDSIQADREKAASMSEAARSNTRFNEALQVARDITQDAETRVRALKQALDELTGGKLSAEEAAKRLSETNLSLAEGLAQTSEAGEKLWQSQLKANGEIEIGTREGLAFADTMSRSRDAMLDAAMAAADQALAHGDIVGAVEAATSAGNGYIETLRQTMTEAGLTQEQINGLIGQYLDVPEVVATLITDNGSISAVDQQLIALAMQIDSTPDKTITISEPLSPAVIQRLKDLGYAVESLPDGNIRVTESGSAGVEATINEVARPRTSIIDLIYREGARPQLGPVKNAVGNLYSDGVAQAFATGGFPSGFYKAPPGQAAIHKFAETELPWEAYISPKPGHRERNIGIALEALRRLAFPVVPANQVYGTRAFAAGDMLANQAAPAAVQTAPAPRRSRRGRAPLVGTINLGKGATRSELDELLNVLDFYERSNR